MVPDNNVGHHTHNNRSFQVIELKKSGEEKQEDNLVAITKVTRRSILNACFQREGLKLASMENIVTHCPDTFEEYNERVEQEIGVRGENSYKSFDDYIQHKKEHFDEGMRFFSSLDEYEVVGEEVEFPTTWEECRTIIMDLYITVLYTARDTFSAAKGNVL